MILLNCHIKYRTSPRIITTLHYTEVEISKTLYCTPSTLFFYCIALHCTALQPRSNCTTLLLSPYHIIPFHSNPSATSTWARLPCLAWKGTPCSQTSVSPLISSRHTAVTQRMEIIAQKRKRTFSLLARLCFNC